MTALEVPTDLELKNLSFTQDLKINNHQADNAKVGPMHSIHTSSVSSWQDETPLDNIIKTDNEKVVDAVSVPTEYHKDVPENKSDIMQKAVDYEDTCSVTDILENDNIIENIPQHQVVQCDKIHKSNILSRI